jgi:SAM-dependent methyltransferase
MQLPFPDESFDAVVCQFGVMFFPDKAKAFAEARRVLKPGGLFLFSVWDRTETNDFADEVTKATADVFPADPPRFLPRTPYGYNDPATIARDVAAGGFTHAPVFDTFTARSRAGSPLIPAIAYCQGTPLRSEIEAREPGGLQRVTNIAGEAVAKRFGAGAVEGKIQSIVVTVEK